MVACVHAVGVAHVHVTLVGVVHVHVVLVIDLYKTEEQVNLACEYWSMQQRHSHYGTPVASNSCSQSLKWFL